MVVRIGRMFCLKRQAISKKKQSSSGGTAFSWAYGGSQDEYSVELRDGSVEKYQVGAMATNEKQVPSGVMDAFVESIVTNTPPSISGEEGLKSLYTRSARSECA